MTAKKSCFSFNSNDSQIETVVYLNWNAMAMVLLLFVFLLPLPRFCLCLCTDSFNMQYLVYVCNTRFVMVVILFWIDDTWTKSWIDFHGILKPLRSFVAAIVWIFFSSTKMSHAFCSDCDSVESRCGLEFGLKTSLICDHQLKSTLNLIFKRSWPQFAMKSFVCNISSDSN